MTNILSVSLFHVYPKTWKFFYENSVQIHEFRVHVPGTRIINVNVPIETYI